MDGLGYRDPAPDNPVREDVCPTLFGLMHGPDAARIDACLGVPGLPQSATGQAALYTGKNAAQQMGRHMEGFPGPTLRALIEEDNIMKTLCRRKLRCKFADGYVAERAQDIRQQRFKSVTTVMALSCPEDVFLLRDDILNNRAVFHDITRESLVPRGYTGPLVAPREAADQLAQIALGNDFTLFEYFVTDTAGHAHSLPDAERTLRTLDAFLAPLLEMALGTGLLFVLTSDHGNIEDMGVRTHTANKIPLFARGPQAKKITRGARSLLDVAPRVLGRLENT
ncbi:MAG: metalloenzyme [Kiritimatiellaeota bacterium]|nr:metalloenzyme [Kiritimatiellota bacterium]